MPTPEWREEKSEHVVKALCSLLARDDLSEEIRSGIENALWDALKLLANSAEERLGDRQSRWSPALVGVFRDQPDKCSSWLELMYEPNFSAQDYWKQ